MYKQQLFFLIFCSGLSFNAWAMQDRGSRSMTISRLIPRGDDRVGRYVRSSVSRLLDGENPHRLGTIEINQLTHQDRENAKEFVSTDRNLCYPETYLENRVRIAKATLCGEYSKEFMKAAMSYQDYPLVAILLEMGADANAKDTEHFDEPLFEAKSVALAQLLVEHGARTNVQGDFGETLLHQAMHEKYSPGLVQYYIDVAKINVDSRRNYDGATPLHTWANFSLGLNSDEKHLPDAQAKLAILLKADAKLNRKDTKERTPLAILQEKRAEYVRYNNPLFDGAIVALNTLINDLSAAMGIVAESPPIVIPNEDQECSICLNTLKGAWCQLNCNHVFHTGCVDTWLKVQKICPLCRNEQVDE